MNSPDPQVAWQVRSVLEKVSVCRTARLLGRLYRCSGCQHRYALYNSCGERHCPQCAGARRADWTDRSSALILPKVDYFQVVFTLPKKLSRLVLGNRPELYHLLFRSAWGAIKQEMLKQNIDPAALLMLHTWDQELLHHPHLHAIVPGGGPSANPDNDPCWVTAADKTRPWRDKPSLVDNVALSRTFRDKFVRGLGWLIRHGKLKLKEEWKQLKNPKLLTRWLKSLRQTDWNVFIEAPPKKNSDPQQVVKYLARYMTGGPISDSRIVSDQDGLVTFTARDNRSRQQVRQIKLSGAEFVRRWSLHILPQGFTRSRGYGGFHGSRRKEYLEVCRKLLSPATPEPTPASEQTQSTHPTTGASPKLQCPRCQSELNLLTQLPRPSWRIVLGGRQFDIDWHYEKWFRVFREYEMGNRNESKPNNIHRSAASSNIASCSAASSNAASSNIASSNAGVSHIQISHQQLARCDD